MPCALFPSPIFGPIHSRRLGVSLGINLLPATAKVCSFDCIYCECGFNKDHDAKRELPTRQEVKEALERKLIKLAAQGPAPDVFTFAGNGEPTSHPEFSEIIEDTIKLRDQYFPDAKISVLTNSTFVNRAKVVQALLKIDNPIMKLDTVNPDFIRLVDRPNAKYDVKKIVEKLQEHPGKFIIQTMFLKGSYEGHDLNNMTDDYVEPWLDALDEIKPREVMIYTLDRETPAEGLVKASRAEMDALAEKVRARGHTVMVSY